ncbi:serine/threonine-protein kinase [Nocardia crassostreae]|uniref:serine/threonine-protein kinase n=1 Tax=Nocardia crassostreae TaxID=53428 RepID=UPI00082F2F90
MTDMRLSLSVGSLFGPYRLVRLVGRGGMGEVYEAYDTVKDRTVAIKVLPDRLAQDRVYRQRFQRESHAAARLREAHVIPIHDYGEIDGHLFIDMRLVDGESLRESLRRGGSRPAEWSVDLIRQIGAALEAAHADGLLHRDVKPDNILVARDGFAYLVDFGIAQSNSDESLTGEGAVGSFHYMAPERFGYHDLTPAVDVYALACVLFECLTGTRPFPAETNEQIMRAHLFDPPPRPSALQPGIPAAFDAVVARGLAKNPDDRYRTAGELSAAARAALPGAAPATADSTTVWAPAVGPTESIPRPDPVTVRSAPPATRTGRGRRILAVLGVLLLVAASTGFAGWSTTRLTTAGAAVPDATALQAADIELLSRAASAGYKRANCTHTALDDTTVAAVTCAANPAADTPLTQFWRFRTLDGLRDHYESLVLNTFRGESCPGEPAGQDGVSLGFNGAAAGRQSCFANHAVSAGAPLPSLAVTNETFLAMAIYTWVYPSDTPQRDYTARNHFGQFLTEPERGDPDAFTDADRTVFARTGPAYTRANCLHNEPAEPMSALLTCMGRADGPNVLIIGYPDSAMAYVGYQSRQRQLPGRECGGTGSDAEWVRSSIVTGRFFCFTETVGQRERPRLEAVHDEWNVVYKFCGQRADNPSTGPKTEAQLLAWFRANFG